MPTYKRTPLSQAFAWAVLTFAFGVRLIHDLFPLTSDWSGSRLLNIVLQIGLVTLGILHTRSALALIPPESQRPGH